MAGNVFLKGAQPCKDEQNPVVRPDSAPEIKLVEDEDGVSLYITLDKTWAEERSRPLVTTKLLGRAKTPDLPYEQPDASPYRIGTDWFGKNRNAANPFPGPFELPEGGRQAVKVWPVVALQ
jgi:alpha-N-arabinofuranosidase